MPRRASRVHADILVPLSVRIPESLMLELRVLLADPRGSTNGIVGHALMQNFVIDALRSHLSSLKVHSG